MRWKLILGISLLLFSCLEHAEPEDILLRELFEGPVVVIYNIPDGQEKRYKNGRRQYSVPESGVLYTQFTKVNGILDRKYVYPHDTTLQIINYNGVMELESNKTYKFDSYSGIFYDLKDSSYTDIVIDKSTTDHIFFTYFTIGKGASDLACLREEAIFLLNDVKSIFPKKISNSSR